MTQPDDPGRRIDLNADVGEGPGADGLDVDAELIPLVSSVNIACGGHAGDVATMERAVRIALGAGTTIGAHPGYPDRAGFGRRAISMSAADLEAAIVDQITALTAVAEAAGATVRHVKPHGALYNLAATDPAVATIVARAVHRCSPDLVLVGLAGSVALDAGRAEGLPVAAEAFPDRAYESDGRLRSRSLPAAVLVDSVLVGERARSMALDRLVAAFDGTPLRVEADTLCLHGDTPGVVGHARAIRAGLEAVGWRIAPLGSAVLRDAR